MPIINFYAKQEDYVKFINLSQEKKDKIKEQIREKFRRLLK